MKTRSSLKSACASVFCMLLFLLPISTWGADAPLKLKVGIVPQVTVQQIRLAWDPVLLSVAKKTGIHFVFVGSPSIPDFEAQFSNGEFDLVYLNPYHMLIANKKQGYQPLVRDIGRALRGILV